MAYERRRDPSADLLVGAGVALAALIGVAWLATRSERQAAAQPLPPGRWPTNTNLPPGAVPVPPGTPLSAPTPSVPAAPTPATPTAPATLVPVGNPALLRTGRHYRARIELSPIESALASPRDVAMRFEMLGFRNVVAYASASELGAGWPASATSGATGATRWAEGDWSGAESSVPLPPQLVAAWEG